MAFETRAGGPATNPYESQMGRTYVAIDETGDIRILDQARVATLGAWVARLIPGNEQWPSAGELDTVAYIDAVLQRSIVLRPIILAAIDAADAASVHRSSLPFAALPVAEQVEVLKELESDSAPQAFAVVLELSYEAYYRDVNVQSAVKARTGFDIARTVHGAPLEPFPTERLERVSLLAPRYREAS